jgi:hypothetical protein
LIGPDNIDRIETNLQIAYAPKSPTRDFRTDYLLKVFDYNAPTQTFEEAPLENQIDRERIRADAKLRRDFKAWLLDPLHFSELDRGTVLIPREFLAKGAIAPTPTGFSPSRLQPAFGLVQGEDGAADPVFTESDVVAALKRPRGAASACRISPRSRASSAGSTTSPAPAAIKPAASAAFIFPASTGRWPSFQFDRGAGSPHFFGDQVRRRDILTALRDGERPDYSRGFSSRPQLRGSHELAGTEYDDGWGAHCYLRHASAADNDRSFRPWTCAEGLACQVVDQASRMGMCFVKTR